MTFSRFGGVTLCDKELIAKTNNRQSHMQCISTFPLCSRTQFIALEIGRYRLLKYLQIILIHVLVRLFVSLTIPNYIVVPSFLLHMLKELQLISRSGRPGYTLQDLETYVLAPLRISDEFNEGQINGLAVPRLS